MPELRVNPNTGESMQLRSPVSLFSYVAQNSRYSRQADSEAKSNSAHSSETASSENTTIPDATGQNSVKGGEKLNSTFTMNKQESNQSQPITTTATSTCSSYTPFHRKAAYSITNKKNNQMQLTERPKKTVAFGLTTNITDTLIKDKEREFISQPFVRPKVGSFLGNSEEVAAIKKEQSAHKSALVELQNKVTELEANDVKQKNEIAVLREKFVELCTIVSGLAEPSPLSSASLKRFHAPAIVEKPILIQKQDRKKEKQRRRTSDDENMSGTNGENSKIVMNQYMSVEKKVIFSSPNRSETVRARYRANATQTRRENGSRPNNKSSRRQPQPIGSVHFDQLSVSTACDENMNMQPLMDYQLSDSLSYTDDSD